ncbi:hypothetical protein KBX50_04745 [Micromonospora sp. C51]|uniref:hypothetical protein n=1 Tax=Micromonospora sp. C51 TaxID=2824879 RepID=UPI001B386CA7|nr:hypothetical protein [Micromonospora sp. C51]MBQ1047797.1 hypothetical protein [Micromonospora sp. C51]
MARSEARVSVDIWDDEDFIEVTVPAQWQFFFLLSQRDLAHSGVLPLRERRWARSAPDLTEADVIRNIAELEQKRYVVIDDDTEELLIRSYIRGDKVFKQPNVLRSAADHLPLIASKKIKATLLVELCRIDAEEDMAEGSRQILKEMIYTLEREVGQASASPSATPTQNPSPNPSGNPSPEGQNKPSADPTRGAPGERGVVTAVRSDSPLPSPPSPDSAATASPSPNAADEPSPPPGRDEPGSRPDVDKICQHLADALVKAQYKRPRITKRWRQEARLLLDEKRPNPVDLDKVLRAIDWAMEHDFWRRNIQSTASLRRQFDRMRDEATTSGRRGNAGTTASAAWNPTDPETYFDK